MSASNNTILEYWNGLPLLDLPILSACGHVGKYSPRVPDVKRLTPALTSDDIPKAVC